jgi:acetyl-CoA carboxylase biotin carboxyl carrier protein
LAHHQLTYDDLLRIVELIRSSEQFSEFRLKVGEIEIELRRRPEAGASASAASSPAPVISAASAPSTPSAATRPAIAVAAGTRAPAATVPAWPPGSIVVRAPMVGTFYRSPEPGAAPFVEVGQAVEPDTTVCIIEVMKLMNSIPAGARGVVAQIFVENGAPVETDAPLIVIDPSRATQ